MSLVLQFFVNYINILQCDMFCIVKQMEWVEAGTPSISFRQTQATQAGGCQFQCFCSSKCISFPLTFSTEQSSGVLSVIILYSL